MPDVVSTPAPNPRKIPSLRSLVNTVVLWAVVLFISFLAYSPQCAWLIFLVWLPLYVGWIWGRWILALVLVPLCGATIAAHMHGYRLVGLIHLIPNDLALGNDVVVAFGPGNLVTLTDGRSFHLAGVRTSDQFTDARFTLADLGKAPAVDQGTASTTFNAWEYLLKRLTEGLPVTNRRRDHFLNLPPSGLPARIHHIDDQHVQLDIPIEYRPYDWRCLPSFDEQWFPPRVPRYRTIDLATALLGSGLFEPDDSDQGRHYRQWMQDNLSRWRR